MRRGRTFTQALVMLCSVLTPTFLITATTMLGPKFVWPFVSAATRAVLIVQTTLAVLTSLYFAFTMAPALYHRSRRLLCRLGSRIRSSLVSLMLARRVQSWPCLVTLFRFYASVVGYSSAESWDPQLCVSPTSVGSTEGGAPFTILGRPGSSVRTMRLYRNSGRVRYIRGLVVVFSDGTEMQAGVRKDEFSEFTLSDDELITGMTLWAYYPSSKTFFSFWRKATDASAVRVGRISITTSQRSWGYGMDGTARLSSKEVNVGSGLLVGFKGRAGNDNMDQIGPIFLKPLSTSVVENIVFEQTPDPDGLRLTTLREGSAVWNGTDYTWNFSGIDIRDASTTFSAGFNSAFSVSPTFTASLPRVLDTGFGATWGQGTTQNYDQHSGSATQLSWSTTIAMSADNPAVSCLAMVWEGRVNLRWSGVQTVMADGVTASFPTSGMLSHVTYGKD
ncbi:predicted protein [Chaetomium globosum CBS 148.51]|uniref:Jacalin-type lectin domain-containing protein n=1 Tax=Chaetomium globosum (strain ATCC 6205 / CBS 148.51 / DSM 1962 / NBRC 6347 / NRRL 1970) TaxID=306901 RepID=Q2H1I1_CHAGB|nr:uncharacterized protein CHGG_04365 [Chaetomium globosum CBS 148.51]EAQ87746.1 predicted protein [Chaetomium globosum CBS 148.51]